MFGFIDMELTWSSIPYFKDQLNFIPSKNIRPFEIGLNEIQTFYVSPLGDIRPIDFEWNETPTLGHSYILLDFLS